MASISDLKLRYRILMKTYSYRTHDWTPGAVLEKPLSEARLAVVTTAAFHRPDQPAFDESIKGGDISYRVIPRDTALDSLQIAHKSDAFDSSGIEADKNLALPLRDLEDMVAARRIGSLSERHFSFMGSIPSPGRLISHTAPEVAAVLKEDGVDAVFLTPVWPLCHQSVGLIQSVIEKSGIPTVSVTMLREVTEKVNPPRALFVDTPLGYPLGRTHDPDLRKEIIGSALSLLDRNDNLPIIEEFPPIEIRG